MRIDDSIIYKINFYLLAFIPFVLITGPFLPDLFCSISGILFIVLCFKYKITKYIKSYFFILFIIFYFVILLSSINSNNILFSLESSLFYFRFGILAINFWFVTEQSGKKFINLSFLTISSAIVLAFLSGYIQYFFNISIFNNEISLDKYNAIRVSGIFGDEYILGSFISRLLPPSLALIFLLYFKSTLKIRIAIFIFIFLSIMMVFISGERTAIVNIILLISLSFLLVKINIKLKMLFIFFVISFFLLFINLDQRIYNRLIVTTSSIVSDIEINKNFNWYFVSQEHQNAFFTSINMFKQNKLLGIGPKMYRKECNNLIYLKNINYSNTCLMHPHNNYLQLMSEIGIFGLLFITSSLLFISYKFIFYFFYHKKNEPIFNYKIFLFISIFIFIWPLNQNGNIFNNWMSIIHFYPIGFLLASKKIKNFF